jgi:hypothetical protein
MTSDQKSKPQKAEKNKPVNTDIEQDVDAIVSSTRAISTSIDETISEVQRAQSDVRRSVNSTGKPHLG